MRIIYISMNYERLLHNMQDNVHVLLQSLFAFIDIDQQVIKRMWLNVYELAQMNSVASTKRVLEEGLTYKSLRTKPIQRFSF
jgi:hypothetical protein